MRTLWITLADPDPPTNGQFLYSDGLIRSLAASGARLDVVGLERGPRRSHGFSSGQAIRWWLAPDESGMSWRDHFSLQAAIACRSTTPLLKVMLRSRLDHGGWWDGIVIDSICAGWALDIVQQAFPKHDRPPLFYLAHNHETSVAMAMARKETHPVKRAIRWVDACKTALLEGRLVRHAALVTSNTPEDTEKFRRQYPDRPVQHLPPGYSGTIVSQRWITADTPRRAVIVGTFDWAPKRHSLESFLKVAAQRLASTGIALQVVGAAQQGYLDGLREAFPSVEFTGPVPEVTPYMTEARIALVPDQLGGFKLKSLDYVFNRLPIMGIDGAVPGVPLVQGETILLYPDHERLAQGVCEMIDDLDRLNGIQNGAYAACQDRFSWTAIGQSLLGAINGVLETRQAKSRPFPRGAGIRGDSSVPG